MPSLFSKIILVGLTVSGGIEPHSHRADGLPISDGWAFCLAFTAPMWTLTGCESCWSIPLQYLSADSPPDDSAAHISEETTNASRAAPLAIMIGVGATAAFGWLLLIAASFATTSVTDLLDTTLALPMGQLFLNVLGKRGMLAIWSLIIVVQVSSVSIVNRF